MTWFPRRRRRCGSKRSLGPRSIALIVASDKPTVGRRIVASLDRIGFPGSIYPVNPAYPECLGHPVIPASRNCPKRPISASSASVMRGSWRPSSRRRSAASSGGHLRRRFRRAGRGGRRLQDDRRDLPRGRHRAVRPNCMGVLNPHDRSTTYLGELRDPAGLAGNVGLVSQSGALCISLLSDSGALASATSPRPATRRSWPPPITSNTWSRIRTPR